MPSIQYTVCWRLEMSDKKSPPPKVSSPVHIFCLPAGSQLDSYSADTPTSCALPTKAVDQSAADVDQSASGFHYSEAAIPELTSRFPTVHPFSVVTYIQIPVLICLKKTEQFLFF